MHFETLKTMPKEEAFIALVGALDEMPEHQTRSQRELLQVWRKLEAHHGTQVTNLDAWGFFDKKHGTNIADGLRRMAQL